MENQYLKSCNGFYFFAASGELPHRIFLSFKNIEDGRKAIQHLGQWESLVVSLLENNNNTNTVCLYSRKGDTYKWTADNLRNRSDVLRFKASYIHGLPLELTYCVLNKDGTVIGDKPENQTFLPMLGFLSMKSDVFDYQMPLNPN